MPLYLMHPRATALSATPCYTTVADLQWHYFYLVKRTKLKYENLCLQCFDAVGWAAGRASGL